MPPSSRASAGLLLQMLAVCGQQQTSLKVSCCMRAATTRVSRLRRPVLLS
jgi:hypothetical protein